MYESNKRSSYFLRPQNCFCNNWKWLENLMYHFVSESFSRIGNKSASDNILCKAHLIKFYKAILWPRHMTDADIKRKSYSGFPRTAILLRFARFAAGQRTDLLEWCISLNNLLFPSGDAFVVCEILNFEVLYVPYIKYKFYFIFVINC